MHTACKNSINIWIKYPDLTFKISENLDMRKWIGFANPTYICPTQSVILNDPE